MWGLLTDSLPGFQRERVFHRLASHLQVLAIQVGVIFGLERFANAAVVEVRGWEVAIGRVSAHQRQRLAAARNASVELSIGFGERARVEECPSKIESAEPRVDRCVRIRQKLDRSLWIAAL